MGLTFVKIFISWSGEPSHTAAIDVRDWLPNVLQYAKPFVSSEDINKGARWRAEVERELESTDFGIIVITQDNLQSPWVNFEAGALSKSVDTSRVLPLLLDMRPGELVGPLSAFQSVMATEPDLLKLVMSINSAWHESIEASRLEQQFAMWWPTLNGKLTTILDTSRGSADLSAPETGAPDAPTDRDMMAEVLQLSRQMEAKLADLGRGETYNTVTNHYHAPIPAAPVSLDAITERLMGAGFGIAGIRFDGPVTIVTINHGPADGTEQVVVRDLRREMESGGRILRLEPTYVDEDPGALPAG
jgi:hypothetical protein